MDAILSSIVGNKRLVARTVITRSTSSLVMLKSIIGKKPFDPDWYGKVALAVYDLFAYFADSLKPDVDNEQQVVGIGFPGLAAVDKFKSSTASMIEVCKMGLDAVDKYRYMAQRLPHKGMPCFVQVLQAAADETSLKCCEVFEAIIAYEEEILRLCS